MMAGNSLRRGDAPPQLSVYEKYSPACVNPITNEKW
jgi:hypothetical protein